MNTTNKLLAGVLAAIIGFGSFGSYKLIIEPAQIAAEQKKAETAAWFAAQSQKAYAADLAAWKQCGLNNHNIAWKDENRMNYSAVRAKLDAERCGPKPVRN